MSALVEYSVENGVAVLLLNNPPVNALSQAVRQEIKTRLIQSEADSAVSSVVIAGAGRLFSGGADIREFDAPVKEPSLPDLIDRIEQCEKPVVIALHGSTLGGGFELAMGCHYRVAHQGGVVGLPEVHLGIIPGAGGTQRLPRLIGAEAAIDAIATGRHIPVAEAKALGAIDMVVTTDVTQAAIEVARAFKDRCNIRRTCDLRVEPSSFSDSLFEEARSLFAKCRRDFEAPPAAVSAIEWACTLPIKDGLKNERSLSTELKVSLQSKAQRHLFFSERLALKIPDIPKETVQFKIAAVGVVGAGTMGAGIAICLLSAGLDVILVDRQADLLERGLNHIQKTIRRDAERGRLSSEACEDHLSRLRGTLSLEDLRDVDLVIESVFESLSLKKAIFQELDQFCERAAVLATNTSTLDINEIAACTTRPERVLGTHFFSPANIMKLLEVVRADKTSKEVVMTIMTLGRKIGKVPVLSGVGYGFIGNRMLEDYVRESQMLLLEGATPAQVDGALEAWGMAMGPCAVMDLAGHDVTFLTRDQNRHLLPDDPLYCVPGDLMYREGRYGQKTGYGFYRYADGRTREVDGGAISLIQSAAFDLNVSQRTDISDAEIQQRCLYALVNRGAQLLEDGIALRASDIDVVWASGYGFPAYRGGPMFYGDTLGLGQIVKAFNDFAGSFGNEYGYWTPAPLLTRLANAGRTFAAFDKASGS
ncbi:MAG: 3-hydroxyacyl-CoA dehydrogenase NAD-binding domain-containing protein [Rhodospirillaceae bacterium]